MILLESYGVIILMFNVNDKNFAVINICHSMNDSLYFGKKKFFLRSKKKTNSVLRRQILSL